MLKSKRDPQTLKVDIIGKVVAILRQSLTKLKMNTGKYSFSASDFSHKITIIMVFHPKTISSSDKK